MERKHSVLLKHLARLTFEGAEADLKERIRTVAAFLVQRYPRGAKTFLVHYGRCLREVYAERYAILEYVGAFREEWLRSLQTLKAVDGRCWEKTERPDLTGGFCIRVGDTVWDCSLKGQLSALKEKLAS